MQRLGVVALDVFGSAAGGRFDPSSSDYDFIARFAPSDAGELLGRRYVAFSEALEALLGRPVDVTTDHPIANPYLRAAMTASRQPFCVAQRDLPALIEHLRGELAGVPWP